MKLASLKGGRDGRLVVVSDDLAWCADAGHIAPTLQAALDDWANVAPRLEALATDLQHEVIPMMRFHERDAASPLPRAYQRLGGATGGDPAVPARADPLLYRGASDGFLAPRDPIPLADPDWGCDLEAEIAVITGDVPQGTSREAALAAIRLVVLVNDLSLRDLVPAELARGLGFVQSRPASALSPVAVTPDALGDAWRDGRLHLPLLATLNGAAFGKAEAGEDRSFDFGALIGHAARTRALTAGTVVGSGAVSSHGADRPSTPILALGDTVRIELKDAAGHSIFGAIEQVVAG